MYWISPVAWAFRGAAVNEFNQDLYDKTTYQEDNGYCGPSGTDCPNKRDGTFMLKAGGITQTERVWYWYGVLVLAFYWIVRVPRPSLQRGGVATAYERSRPLDPRAVLFLGLRVPSQNDKT